MSETERTSSGKRRRRAIVTPLAVGAIAGAALVAGYGAVHTSSRTAAPATAQTATQSTDVALTAAEYDAETIYKRDSPGVVDITVTMASQGQGEGLSPFDPQGGASQAEGTGFVYDKQGNIVTADHVVDGATAITVRFKDGTTTKATLVGTDPSTDTAVIKVNAAASRLTPLALADSDAVEAGEGVVAIGSPFGLSNSITAGIVSAVDRDIEAPNGYSIPNTIQTDAAINHGNSGGPLIDSSGEVIGVNVQIATGDNSASSQNAGVGFAVPSNTVKAVTTALIAGQPVEHAYLGVSIGNNADGVGAQIGTVTSGGPAAHAGIQTGDVVIAIDGQTVADADDLTAAIASRDPGDKITLKLTRNGSTKSITVVLGTRPATTS